MRKKHIEIFLLTSAPVAIATAFFASAEKLFALPEGAPRFLFFNFPAYNDVILNLASGYTVSVFLYFLVVFIPDYRRCQCIRTNTLKVYQRFKEDVLTLILHAAEEPLSDTKKNDLFEPENFDDYFGHKVNESKTRWDEFLNGLDRYYVEQIAMELEILREEILFLIGNLNIDNEATFSLLKNLATTVYAMSKVGSDYDEQKAWGRFLWSIYSPCDPKTGKRLKDPVLEILEKL